MKANHTSPDFSRVFEIIDYQIQKYPQRKAVNGYVDGSWKSYSINELKKCIDNISSWFIDEGYRKGDCIAIVPKQGSPDWMMIDFACQQIGMITVPIHSTSSVEETEFILKETEAKICIVQHQQLWSKIQNIISATSLRQVFHIDEHDQNYFPALKHIDDRKPDHSLLEKHKAAIGADDVLAIMYTSGTTGLPKGAVLTHTNVVSSVKSVLSIFPLAPSHRVLSFLPISHIFERTTLYTYFAFGVQIYFNVALEDLQRDFKAVRPHFCTSVPRTLEKMYDVLDAQRLSKHWVYRKIITWAMDVGERYRDEEKTGILYRLHLFWARIWVLRWWKNRLGGKLQCMVVGAAALRPEISRLFSAAGIITLSGYGMTEASPFISVNRNYPGLNRFGTVGIPVSGVELRIDKPNENDEGEILVKGPNIIRGYYRRDELNRALFLEDGWFRTGDVGKFVEKRFLKITDRKKDIFKTSAGKYIAPQPLENYFASSPFILQALIIGFNRPFVTAVFVPNFSILKNWCGEQHIHWTAPKYMVHNIKIVQKLQNEVDRLNASLEGFKQVKKFILADDEWTVEGKQLTASFKLVRSKLFEKYKDEIEKLY